MLSANNMDDMKMIMATDSSKSDHQETIIDQDQFKPAK
jgi:hypothetical protein